MAWTIAISIILIGGAALFAYLSNTMDGKEHFWLKFAFIFFSLIALMFATNVGINIVESQNTTYNVSVIDPIITRLGNVYLLQMMALLIGLAYFFIYFFLKIFSIIKVRKKEKEDEL